MKILAFASLRFDMRSLNQRNNSWWFVFTQRFTSQHGHFNVKHFGPTEAAHPSTGNQLVERAGCNGCWGEEIIIRGSTLMNPLQTSLFVYGFKTSQTYQFECVFYFEITLCFLAGYLYTVYT